MFSNLNSLQVGPGIVIVKAVGGNAPSTITPVEFEGLQSTSFDIDTKIVSAKGQNMMAFDSAPVDRDIKGTIEMLALNGTLFANIISGDTPTTGGNAMSYREEFTLASVAVSAWVATTAYTKGQVVSVGSTLLVCNVAGTSGASSPTAPTTLGGTVTDGAVTWIAISADTGAPTHACVAQVAQATAFTEDEGVMYVSTNNQLATLGGTQGLTPLPGPPAVGQYVCAGTSGWYLFNAGDAGQVFISYTWTSSTAVSTFPILNHWIGWGPYCELNMQFPYQSVDQEHILVGLHLLAVRFGSQKVKTKRDGYMTVTYDWEAFCPPSGVAGQFYLPD